MVCKRKIFYDLAKHVISVLKYSGVGRFRYLLVRDDPCDSEELDLVTTGSHMSFFVQTCRSFLVRHSRTNEFGRKLNPKEISQSIWCIPVVTSLKFLIIRIKTRQ